jgi:hypothetical protein
MMLHPDRSTILRACVRLTHCTVATLLVALAGCVVVPAPRVNPAAGGSVTVEVGFRSQVCNPSRFHVELDGVDVTAQFSPQPPASPQLMPSATFTNLAPGVHTVVASADVRMYFFVIPYCDRDSQTQTFTIAAPPAPQLGFAPPGPLTMDVGGSIAVGATIQPVQGTATSVTVVVPPGAPFTAPGSTTIPANAGQSAALTLSGVAAGSGNLLVSAAGTSSASLAVSVRPVLSAVSPASGVPGSSVTLTGLGFASGAAPSFGGTPAAAAVAPAGTSLVATVPVRAAGPAALSVSVNGQTSGTLSFAVLAPPPPPPPTFVMVRAAALSASTVQTIGFSAGSFSILDDDPAPAAALGGTATLAVAANGAGLPSSNVIYTNASHLQSYAISGTGPGTQLTAVGGPVLGATSVTGAAVAAAGSLVVRAVDAGLETYSLIGGNLTRLTRTPVPGRPGSVSGTGVAVDVAGTLAVRAHSAGIDVYDVSTPAAPVLAGSARGTVATGISSNGVGVRVAGGAAGSFVVRSHPTGIEVYTVDVAGVPTLVFPPTPPGMTSSAINTSVAVNATATLAVRSHVNGIEVFSVVTPSAPVLLGSASGAPSTTGSAVVIIGSTAFRAFNGSRAGIEAYDISTPSSIPPPLVIDRGIAASTIGVGLTGL